MNKRDFILNVVFFFLFAAYQIGKNLWKKGEFSTDTSTIEHEYYVLRVNSKIEFSL